MSARDEVLGRVRAALADVAEGDAATDVPVPWEYGRPVPLPGELVEVFAERVEDYEATVVRCGADAVPGAVVEGLRALGSGTVVVPDGLDATWKDAIREAGMTVLPDRRDDGARLTAGDLNGIDAVVTASAVGIAETGTIVLDHAADQGRRALTLVPDRHVCVVAVGDVVSGVPEAVARLRQAVGDGRPLTWISGPSATSDIELSRVEGVHGPRSLYVIVAG